VTGFIWYEFADGEYTSVEIDYSFDSGTRIATHTIDYDLAMFEGIVFIEVGKVLTASSA